MTPPEFEPVMVLDESAPLAEVEGVRFTLRLDGLPRDAFAVRWRGRPYAYLNTCRHQGLNLDFGDAHFFDEACDALVCCHHGARYDPASGACTGGPCAGGRLTALLLEERGGALWCLGLAGRGPRAPA